jgi:hypothetical protein
LSRTNSYPPSSFLNIGATFVPVLARDKHRPEIQSARDKFDRKADRAAAALLKVKVRTRLAG